MSDLKRTLRLLKMLGALHGARFHTVGQLAERFGVSERTVFRDLADLSRDWPLESNPEGSGYRLPPGASLPPLALTMDETALLRALLEQPIVGRDAALRRTARALSAKLAAALAAFDETPAGLRLATLDRSGPQAERAHVGLLRAIENRRAVEIVYESLSGRDQRARPRGLDPWQLFHRGDAWYVAGFCRTHREPRIFRLDRISKVVELPGAARRPEEVGAEEGGTRGAGEPFDLDAFLADSWSVVTGRERHEVVVEFAAAVAPLVANARHHPGEATKRLPGGAVEYRVTLAALDELARWLLGFGGAAKVLAPPELRRRVLSLARATLEANGATTSAPLRTRPEDPLPELPKPRPRPRRST